MAAKRGSLLRMRCCSTSFIPSLLFSLLEVLDNGFRFPLRTTLAIQTGTKRVTTPHGSRARGFLNDIGMSSHPASPLHAHQRLVGSRLGYDMALWEHVSAFTVGNALPANP